MRKRSSYRPRPVLADQMTIAVQRHILKSAIDATRKTWLDKLMHDRLRAWSHIDEVDAGCLNGLATMLTLAGLAWSHDSQNKQASPSIQVIKGGLSMAKQCAKSGCVITLDSARSLTAAAEHASDVISAATDDAIQAEAIMFDRMSAEIYEQTNHAA